MLGSNYWLVSKTAKPLLKFIQNIDKGLAQIIYTESHKILSIINQPKNKNKNKGISLLFLN